MIDATFPAEEDLHAARDFLHDVLPRTPRLWSSSLVGLTAVTVTHIEDGWVDLSFHGRTAEEARAVADQLLHPDAVLTTDLVFQLADPDGVHFQGFGWNGEPPAGVGAHSDREGRPRCPWRWVAPPPTQGGPGTDTVTGPVMAVALVPEDADVLDPSVNRSAAPTSRRPPNLGWVCDAREALALQRRLAPTGRPVLAAVHYVHLDYFRERFAPDRLHEDGARHITDPEEVATALWRTSGPDTVDHGVQMTFADGRALSVGWDLNTSEHEALGSEWTPFLQGTWLARGAQVAIWDVTDSSEQWRTVVGAELQDVDPAFVSDELGWHCCAQLLSFSTGAVRITLGGIDADGRVFPVGDNLLIHRL